MRTLDVALAEHLEQSETTLARCWRIRRSDGVTLGFTDHDRDLLVDGTVCSPAWGLDSGEVPARLGGGVDTGEVLGILDSPAIHETDIALGRYDGARVESWVVNWIEPAQRVLLRVDTIGEIVREDGVFRAELRSPQQALNVTHGRVYQRLCDAVVGDARCGVDLMAPAFTASAVVTAVDDAFRLRVSGIESFDEGWFSFGMARWIDGARSGLGDAVLTHQRMDGDDVLGFAQRVGDWVEIGDGLALTAGCDRRFATCRVKFGNAVNFRGFPYIPGNDYVLRHPGEGDALDGRAVVP